jgi:hypothetical protein
MQRLTPNPNRDQIRKQDEIPTKCNRNQPPNFCIL